MPANMELKQLLQDAASKHEKAFMAESLLRNYIEIKFGPLEVIVC